MRLLSRLFGDADPRARLVERVEGALGGIDPTYARALRDVPREHFVRPEDAARAYDDIPLPLDAAEEATISAPHAYVLSFALAELAPGDRLLELGTGSGYGAALAASVVGPEGRVVTIEIDPDLALRAEELLADRPNVSVVLGDGMTDTGSWEGVNKIIVTFALLQIPDAWRERLAEGALLVVPVGPRDMPQRLVRLRRKGGVLEESTHGAVRYVSNRGAKA
jgi:protein-L-isoaspartate(D-aspartate) O-methyltransferase